VVALSAKTVGWLTPLVSQVRAIVINCSVARTIDVVELSNRWEHQVPSQLPHTMRAPAA